MSTSPGKKSDLLVYMTSTTIEVYHGVPDSKATFCLAYWDIQDKIIKWQKFEIQLDQEGVGKYAI